MAWMNFSRTVLLFIFSLRNPMNVQIFNSGVTLAATQNTLKDAVRRVIRIYTGLTLLLHIENIFLGHLEAQHVNLLFSLRGGKIILTAKWVMVK